LTTWRFFPGKDYGRERLSGVGITCNLETETGATLWVEGRLKIKSA